MIMRALFVHGTSCGGWAPHRTHKRAARPKTCDPTRQPQAQPAANENDRSLFQILQRHGLEAVLAHGADGVDHRLRAGQRGAARDVVAHGKRA